MLALIVVSAISSVGVFAAVEDAQSRRLPQGAEMAGAISASDCEDVWIEGSYEGASLPHEKPLAYELTKRGVALQAVNYGKIG